MEPQHNNEYMPGAELPQLEDNSGSVYVPEQGAKAPEIRNYQPVSKGGSGTVSQVTSGSPATAPLTTQSSSATPVITPFTVALTADDADLIEKEWVMRAKTIVMQTKNDPRAQNIQMNSVKADYLKKRYNKDLRVTET